MGSTVDPLFHVLETHPLGLVDLETLLDELLEIFRDIDAGSELNRDFSHFLDELSLGLAVPRSLAMKHLIDHDSDGPNIIFSGIDVLFESLGGHVEGTAYVIFFLF